MHQNREKGKILVKQKYTLYSEDAHHHENKKDSQNSFPKIIIQEFEFLTF